MPTPSDRTRTIIRNTRANIGDRDSAPAIATDILSNEWETIKEDAMVSIGSDARYSQKGAMQRDEDVVKPVCAVVVAT